MWPFGRSKKSLLDQISRLQNDLKLEHDNAIAATIRCDNLIRQIRDMDQLIYSMGQCTGWSSMRPIFHAYPVNTHKR